MAVTVNPKGSLHFDYTKAYPIDSQSLDYIPRSFKQMKEEAQEHYENMFSKSIAVVVVEDPVRVESTASGNNGLIVFNVEVGVFFDWI